MLDFHFTGSAFVTLSTADEREDRERAEWERTRKSARPAIASSVLGDLLLAQLTPQKAGDVVPFKKSTPPPAPRPLPPAQPLRPAASAAVELRKLAAEVVELRQRLALVEAPYTRHH